MDSTVAFAVAGTAGGDPRLETPGSELLTIINLLGL